MSKIVIEFNIDNAAFEDSISSESEYVLSEVLHDLKHNGNDGILYDSDGKRIGLWRIEND